MWVFLFLALITTLVPNDTFARSIRITSNVPRNQKLLLSRDLQLLKTLSVENPDSKLLEIMHTDAVDSGKLEGWLEDRVQYVVGESFKFNEALFIAEPSYSYENLNDVPVFEKATKHTGGNSSAKVIMSNIGVSAYFKGKEQHTLSGLKIPGVDDVRMTSPRVGVVQIGEGLFYLFEKRLPKSPQDSMAKSLARLSTLFHEARHSDGHGKSLGFFHAVCPEGHHLAGYSACDRNLNGPYTVGALVQQLMTESCDTCSVEEKEVLRLNYLDSFGRVIQETSSVDWDDRPEGSR